MADFFPVEDYFDEDLCLVRAVSPTLLPVVLDGILDVIAGFEVGPVAKQLQEDLGFAGRTSAGTPILLQLGECKIKSKFLRAETIL